MNLVFPQGVTYLTEAEPAMLIPSVRRMTGVCNGIFAATSM